MGGGALAAPEVHAGGVVPVAAAPVWAKRPSILRAVVPTLGFGDYSKAGAAGGSAGEFTPALRSCRATRRTSLR